MNDADFLELFNEVEAMPVAQTGPTRPLTTKQTSTLLGYTYDLEDLLGEFTHAEVNNLFALGPQREAAWRAAHPHVDPPTGICYLPPLMVACRSTFAAILPFFTSILVALSCQHSLKMQNLLPLFNPAPRAV